MRLQHIRAMARKEWWHLLRDPRSLALILLMPSMLLFLFGYAIRLDITDIPFGILQESRDARSNELAARLRASRGFDVIAEFRDREAMTTAIQTDEVLAALVIPRDFAGSLQDGDAKLQLIVDGADANTARLVINYVQALVNDYTLQLTPHPPPVRVESRAWFNEAKESRNAIVPGVIAIVMAVIGALMTSLTVAREMEAGNLVLLRTTALTRSEFLAGKLFPYFVIGMADLGAAVLVATWVFDVPLRGDLLGLAFFSALFLLVVMLQGTIISIAAGNQILASQMSMVITFLPAFLLSGFVFAIKNMPVALQYLTLIVPARYYVALSKLIFLKGISPLLVWTEALALFVMFCIFTVVTYKRAKKLGLVA